MDIQATSPIQTPHQEAAGKSISINTDESQFEEEFNQAQSELDQPKKEVQDANPTIQTENQDGILEESILSDQAILTEDELLQEQELVEQDQLLQSTIEPFTPKQQTITTNLSQGQEYLADLEQGAGQTKNLIEQNQIQQTKEKQHFLKEAQQFEKQIEQLAKENAIEKENLLKEQGKQQKTIKDVEIVQLDEQNQVDQNLTKAKADQMALKDTIASLVINQEFKDKLINKKEAQKLYDQSLHLSGIEQNQRSQEGASTLIKNTNFQTKAAVENNAVQIINNIKILMDQDKQRLIMKLEPEDIGKLEIKIEKQGDTLKAKFVVESNEAKSYLEQNLLQIQKNLEEQGITLKSIDIFNNQAQDQHQTQQQFINENNDDVVKEELLIEESASEEQQNMANSLLSIKI